MFELTDVLIFPPLISIRSLISSLLWISKTPEITNVKFEREELVLFLLLSINTSPANFNLSMRFLLSSSLKYSVILDAVFSPISSISEGQFIVWYLKNELIGSAAI